MTEWPASAGAAAPMRPHPAFDPPLDRCPLCASAAIAWFDRDAWGVTIFRCADCGTRFMNPPYTDAALAEFYDSYITRYEPKRDERRLERRRLRKERAFALIERFIRPGSLLSVGSGDGLELEVARRRGWTVLGHDLDSGSAADIRERTGMDVLEGPLFDHDLPAASFDCVVMDQVLEHLREPADYLRFVRRLLRPGGVLYVGVPNIGSVASEWQRWMGRIGLKRRTRGRHYDTGHHVLYFTPRVLASALDRQFDFDVLAVEGDPNVGAGAAAAVDWLRTRLPMLDSSMRIVARVRP